MMGSESGMEGRKPIHRFSAGCGGRWGRKRQALHHRIGPVVVGLRLKPCELDRATDPVAAVEGCGDEALAFEHDRTAETEGAFG